jgi:hypothetical protein
MDEHLYSRFEWFISAGESKLAKEGLKSPSPAGGIISGEKESSGG